MNGMPDKFKLGTGHVKFFYNKLFYLFTRYLELYVECRKRGFNVQDYRNAWKNVPKELMGNYIPTENDRKLVQKRINEKLNK